MHEGGQPEAYDEIQCEEVRFQNRDVPPSSAVRKPCPSIVASRFATGRPGAFTQDRRILAAPTTRQARAVEKKLAT
jgi:hypothetical protein